MILAFFLERFQSWKQWPLWCWAIMLCANERLTVDHSDIYNPSGPRVATLAGGVHFFWRHFDLI